MWGTIIGDIIGSSFENENLRSPFFEFFRQGSRFTDDTVCTAAIADILEKSKINNIELDNDYISNQLRLWCCTYLNRGFGSMFYQWIANGINKPYNSYGNGALMRVSPVAKFAVKYNLSKNEALKIAERVTIVTHNNMQALVCVKAYTEILYDFLMYEKEHKAKINKQEADDMIRKILQFYDIPTPLKIEEYRVKIEFDLTCYTSLGIACASILETDNFEDVMYQVVSAGGDSDTYAAIAGAVAEAIYDVPAYMKEKIKPFFREYDKDIIVAIETLYD